MLKLKQNNYYFKMKNKTAIVTGASRGIGRTITEKLLKSDYNVLGVYEKRSDKAEELEKKYPNIKMIKADIEKSKNAKLIVNTATKEFGGINVLINNAGIFLGGFIKKFSLKDWNRIIGVNLTSKFLLCKYALPYLEKSRNGVIINISSRFGLHEYNQPYCIAYGVTNAGINNFTVGLARELEGKVRVNAVIPTVTNTDRFKNSFNKEEQEEIKKTGKLGTPEEAADSVIELINDESKNGEIIVDKRVYIKSEA